MRNEELLVMGLAGLALWFILKGQASGSFKMPTYVKKAAPDYEGWQYFTDGTAISPEGSYYLNGAKVWSPQ